MIGDRLRLDGRTVVVAGAGGGGIGTAVCTAAAELGARVVGLDVDDGSVDTAATAVAGRSEFLGIVCDVREEADVDRALGAAVARFGSVDGLVHVVGGQRSDHWRRLDDLPPATFDEVLDLNLRSALLTGKAVAAVMRAGGHGGSIVNIASVAGFVAAPYNAAYAAAKAGLMSLTRTMAAEWGRHGIRVNAVAPGTIRTPRGRGSDAPDAARDAVLALGRRGTPEEIAGAVMFVLSDLGSFVTGQTIVADGGSIIRPSYLDADDLPVFVEDREFRRRLLGP